MLGIDMPAPACTHALSTVETAERLGVDVGAGLSAAEAAARARRFGRNVVTGERGPGWPRRLFAQLHNPLIYVLLAAGRDHPRVR